jgi:hypothetical protein
VFRRRLPPVAQSVAPELTVTEAGVEVAWVPSRWAPLIFRLKQNVAFIHLFEYLFI